MYSSYNLDMKVKTVCLTSRNPNIMDLTIRNAIPKDANVFNYIFCYADGHYFCHILYYDVPEYGLFADSEVIEPVLDERKDNK